MKCAAVAAWSAVFFVGVATAAYSAAQGDAPPKPDQAQTTRSLESLFGKTLISIDGSTIEIIAAEGRFSREIVAANGAVQRSNFVFINQRLGTVADARDAQRVIGVFRASSEEILIQYGDGSSEIVRLNAESGLTIEMSSPKAATYCTSWYPEGHVFSLDDRKTALLQYANRLGLGVSSEKAAGTPARSGCENAAPSATAASSTTSAPAASPVPAVAPAPAANAPPAAAPAMDMPDAAEKAASAAAPPAGAGTPAVLPSIATASAAAAAKAAELPATPPVAEVPVTAKVAETVATKAAEMATTPKPADAKPAENTQVASLPETDPVEVRKSDVHLIDPPPVTQPTAAVATTDMPKPEGASSCLNVESDGAHWGFRNKCAFAVQYAYCTMDGRNQLTACKDGFVGGSVAPNGFGVLVADQNLRALNENHDFRWVACQGGAGEVIARLDKSDPPAGRCVR
jgi:hypothetical protein